MYKVLYCWTSIKGGDYTLYMYVIGYLMRLRAHMDKVWQYGVSNNTIKIQNGIIFDVAGFCSIRMLAYKMLHSKSFLKMAVAQIGEGCCSVNSIACVVSCRAQTQPSHEEKGLVTQA